MFFRKGRSLIAIHLCTIKKYNRALHSLFRILGEPELWHSTWYLSVCAVVVKRPSFDHDSPLHGSTHQKMEGRSHTIHLCTVNRVIYTHPLSVSGELRTFLGHSTLVPHCHKQLLPRRLLSGGWVALWCRTGAGRSSPRLRKRPKLRPVPHPLPPPLHALLPCPARRCSPDKLAFDR